MPSRRSAATDDPPHPGRVRSLIAAGALIAVGLVGTPMAVGADADELDPDLDASERLIAPAQAMASPMLAGANDWSCRPSAEHPRPVVLVHGTLARGTDVWWLAASKLSRAGYCVFSLDYGGTELGTHGLGPIEESADELATFIDGVLAATKATQVDIVGHSQGGMMPRKYLQNEGTAAVRRLVAISPTSQGTTIGGLDRLARAVPAGRWLTGTVCPACIDQLADSDFIRDLNADGATLPGVEYIVVATKYDSVATPHQSQFITDGRARNHLVQDYCEFDLVQHDGMPYNGIVLELVGQALDPSSRSGDPGCLDILPF